MANIRINIQATAGGGDSNKALDELAARLDKSMQAAATSMTNRMGGFFSSLELATQRWTTRFEQNLKSIEAAIDRISGKMSSVGATSGGAAAMSLSGGINSTGAFLSGNRFVGGGTWSSAPSPAEIIAQRRAEQEALKVQNQQTGIARFNQLVNQYGMSQTGTRIAFRNGQEVENQIFAGSSRTLMQRLTGKQTDYSATLNTSTGGFSFKESVSDTHSLWKNLMNIKDTMVGIAASIFSFQSIGGMLQRYLIDPFKNFVKLIFSASDEFRRFENSISGVAGGASRARAIDSQLLLASRSSPMTISQLHEAGVGLTFTQYGASRVSAGSASSAAGAMLDYATMLQQLSNLAPEQGVGGAQIAVREALAGNFQSARRRLNTSPELIAGSLRKPDGGTYTLAEITGNQNLTMNAFKAFAQTWIGQEPIEGQKGLFSNASAKLKDSLTQAAAGVGNAGVYDKIVDRFRGMADQIYQFLDSPKYKEFAKKVSDGIVKTFDAIFDSIVGFMQRITGTNNIQDMLGKLGDAVGNAADWTSNLISYIPKALSAIGHFLGLAVDAFSGAATAIYEAVKHPGQAAVGAFSQGMAENLSGWGNFISGGRIPTIQFGGPMSTLKRPDLSWQSSSDIGAPFQREREVRAMAYGGSGFGNLRPLMMGMLNDITDSSKLFQAVGGEGTAFEFPQNPFTRAMGTAQSLSGAISGKLVNGDNARISYGDMLRATRNEYERLVGVNSNFKMMDRMGASAGPFDMAGRFAKFGAGSINPAYRSIWSAAEKDRGGMLEAVTGFPGAAGTQFGNMAGSLAQQVSSLAPSIQSATLQKIMTNLNGVIDDFANQLRLGPAERTELNKRFREAVGLHPDFFLGAQRDANMANVTAQGTYGGYSAGKGYFNPTSPRQFRQQQMGEYFASATRFQQAADKEYATNGATDLYASLSDSAAKDRFTGKKLEHDLNDALVALETFSGRARDAIEGGIGDALYGLITQTSSVSDAFKSMANSILKSFSDMTANMLMMGIFGPDFMKPGQGSGGIGLGSLGGLLGGLFNVSGKADGGIFPGSFLPFQAFSGGGIAHSPTMGLVAEAGRPEAIVPLPNGRSIPVEMRGHAGGRTFVVQSEAQARQMGYNPSTDDLVNLIADDIHRGGKIHKAMKAKMR